jgi:glyoxylase-like metal-dependent hydrolase (beta-lactamase superfamily II)
MLTIHRYAASATGLLANAYLVETADGVVAVDAPLLLADGAAYRARLDALGVPLVGVLLTHSHPDHYNTVTQLTAGLDVPIVATVDADRVMREHDDAKRAQWRDMFGDQWPDSSTFANRTVVDGETLTLAGVSFTARDLGRGECASQTVWLVNDGVDGAFIGDMVFHGMHAYLGEGALDQWIDMLAGAQDLLAHVPVLYPGHGAPSGAAMLGDQRRYLLTLREALRRLSDADGRLSAAATRELTALMDTYLPGAPLLWLIEAGAGDAAAGLRAQALDR